MTPTSHFSFCHLIYRETGCEFEKLDGLETSSFYYFYFFYLTRDQFAKSWFVINPFIPNAPSFTPENMMLSGGRERVHWEQMG